MSNAYRLGTSNNTSIDREDDAVMPTCPIHKVPYDHRHASCMRKFMGIPDPGGPEEGDSMLPQDVLEELKKRYTVARSSQTNTEGDAKS